MPVAQVDRYNAALTYSYGTFKFNATTLGLYNASSTFQHVMNTVFFLIY